MYKCVHCGDEQEFEPDTDGRYFMWRDCDCCHSKLSMKREGNFNASQILRCSHDGKTLSVWEEIKNRPSGGNF